MKEWICKRCKNLVRESIHDKKIIIHNTATGEVGEVDPKSVELVHCPLVEEMPKAGDTCPHFKPKNQ